MPLPTQPKHIQNKFEVRTYVLCPGFETRNPPNNRPNIYALDRMVNRTIDNICLGRQTFLSLQSTTRIKVEEM